MTCTLSKDARRVTITEDNPISDEAPIPPFLAGPCPTCGEPLARPGTVAKYHKWYHEACLPDRSALTKGGMREGAGRKELHPELRKVRRVLYLSPDLDGWLVDCMGNGRAAVEHEIIRIVQQHRDTPAIF